jgi:N-acetyltransferase
VVAISSSAATIRLADGRTVEKNMSFDGQPTLRGTLLEVRPLRADDHAALYAVARDPLIWEQHPDQTRHQEAGFAKFFQESLDTGGALLVTDAATGRAIGSSRFFGYSEERGEVEIGWTFLARSHWGGTYNAELKQLMLAHAFRFVESVIFFVHPQNIRSQRAMAKIGGVLEGSGMLEDRDPPDRLLFRITASAFREAMAPSERQMNGLP